MYQLVRLVYMHVCNIVHAHVRQVSSISLSIKLAFYGSKGIRLARVVVVVLVKQNVGLMEWYSTALPLLELELHKLSCSHRFHPNHDLPPRLELCLGTALSYYVQVLRPTQKLRKVHVCLGVCMHANTYSVLFLLTLKL